MTSVALALAAALPGAAFAQAAAPKPAPAAVTPAHPAQRTFDFPEMAALALADAVRARDPRALLAVVGPQSEGWIFSGDPVADRDSWARFVDAYDTRYVVEKQGDSRATLLVGRDDWPFPAPLVKKAGRWRFDADAGRDEVLNRRIGRNELDTIQTLLAIVDAQRQYAAMDPDGQGIAAYAMRFLSSPGKKDGLYWETGASEPPSPLGPLIGAASSQGYVKKDSPQPYHGYRYRMLTRQGKDTPGGAYDYLVAKRLFGGFAVVAWPATYRNSGVKTFIVNHDGIVYEKDLGPGTAAAAASITAYNPDKTWQQSQ